MSIGETDPLDELLFSYKRRRSICQRVRLRDLENTDLPVIISSYCNVKTGELAYEDICTEPQRHNS